MQPVLDQVQIVANAAAIEPNPMDALDPISLKSIFLQCRAAEIETFWSLVFADKVEYDKLLEKSTMKSETFAMVSSGCRSLMAPKQTKMRWIKTS